MVETQAKTRALTEADIPKLKPGDKIVFDVVAGSRVTSFTSGAWSEYFKSHGLEQGKQYTYVRRERALRPGEGTHQGWYVYVEEATRQPLTPFEFFSITPDLEARLAERRS